MIIKRNIFKVVRKKHLNRKKLKLIIVRNSK